MEFGVLFILGLGVFGGILGAWFFQRIRVPQVVGYIVIGVIVGESGFRLVTAEHVEILKPFNLFALGIIGFLVGGELKIEAFRKYARQFMAILLGEGLGAFFLVGLPCTIIVYQVVHDPAIALAAGVVFGAIASATDPASTIDVLWEYRARGVLTTSITAIVALDDALAMLLYGLGTSAAQLLTQGAAEGSGSILAELGHVAYELGGSIVLGVAFAAVLVWLLRWLHEKERTTALAIGLILLLLSIAAAKGFDVILAAMALGFVVTNAAPRRSAALFTTLRGFSVPIYVLFFVLVGARLSLRQMPLWLIAIVVVYVVMRCVGKAFGAYLGARITKAEPVVQRYLGMGLFAQGGVAVGLSIMAGQHLAHIPVTDDMFLGDAIIFAVTTTTLLVQIIGPAAVKIAVQRAGEAGRNVTEEDVIKSLTAADVMFSDITPICEEEPLDQVVRRFSEHDHLVYPVVNKKDQLLGIVSLADLREVLTDQATWSWLVASDVVRPVADHALPETPLIDAIATMRQVQLDQMPVLARGEGLKPVGLLDSTHIRNRVEHEILMRQGNLPAEA